MMGDYPMKTRAIMTFGVSALIMGGTMVGCTHDGIASASTRADRAGKLAADNAAKASSALARGNANAAVKLAETAVQAQPRNASYRVLLGGAYLKVGRFDSARQTYADAISLDPANGKAALNLALAQIGAGKWDEARATLDAHKDIIAVSDRGLAMALAGDPNGAVELLVAAARTPQADAKMRQNLALSLALAGQWQQARLVASMDLSPADVDKRIQQWATFARPKSASDQIAALLGVVPVSDPGQPAVLALNAPVSVGVASAAPAADAAPAQAVADVAPVEAAPAPQAEAAPVQVASAAPVVRFAERHEVVQALPVQAAKPIVAAVVRPVPVAPAVIAPQPVVAKGNFFVQLGAYQNPAIARDAWGHAAQRYTAFAGKTPSGVTVNVKGKSFYRLSVGGFARADADSLCTGYRAKGGNCFVRAGAGDQAANWSRGKQVASR